MERGIVHAGRKRGNGFENLIALARQAGGGIRR